MSDFDYDASDNTLVQAIADCDARHADLTEQVKAVAAERGDAFAGLVANERARRARLGVSPRGAATAVAAKLGISPERVYAVLAARGGFIRQIADDEANAT